MRQADSGEIALASVAADPPELILLDILMPVMDGFEVLRRLKVQKESSEIPVIFLSAFTEVEQKVEGLKLGAADFISKPFQREELLARVRTHLELFKLRYRLEHQAGELRRTNEQLQIEIDERKALRGEAETPGHPRCTHRPFKQTFIGKNAYPDYRAGKKRCNQFPPLYGSR